MALMHPATCPPHANAAERAAFALLDHVMDAGWAAWFQVALPGRPGGGRGGPPRRVMPLRADFVLLGAGGLTILEVKGWHGAAIAAANDSRVAFQNGIAVGHPLVQAYRYTAALAGLLRAQPGVLGATPIPVRYAVLLPYLSLVDLLGAAWAPAFRDPRVLLEEDLTATLPGRLAALPPPGPSLTAAQTTALGHLLTRTAGPPPSAHWPPLF